MIKIDNLTKIYHTKAKAESIALESVNLVLPNKGFVFILEKSGSEK